MSPKSIGFYLSPRRGELPRLSAKAIVEQDKLLPVEDARSPHNARVRRVGPDGKLYIAMGQPYNVPPKRKMGEFNKRGIGGIIRMNLDGSITRGIEIIVAVASVTANTGKRGGGKRTVWTLCRPAVSGLRSRRTWRRRAHSHDSFDLWTYDGTLEDIHRALYASRDVRCREQAQRGPARPPPPSISTFALLNRCRGLAKDCENLTRNAPTFLHLTSIRLMLRKICSPI